MEKEYTILVKQKSTGELILQNLFPEESLQNTLMTRWITTKRTAQGLQTVFRGGLSEILDDLGGGQRNRPLTGTRKNVKLMPDEALKVAAEILNRGHDVELRSVDSGSRVIVYEVNKMVREVAGLDEMPE